MNKTLINTGELMSVITKISSKNQITLPVAMTNQMGLGKNQRVKVVLDLRNGANKISFETLPDPIARLRGILKGTNFGVKHFLRERYEDDKTYDL
jgi:bifunctional DNA-binding transcriptional regulator/antitoxin component of YhaV-PrlF toxin-antitoxin module